MTKAPTRKVRSGLFPFWGAEASLTHEISLEKAGALCYIPCKQDILLHKCLLGK